MKIDLHSIAFSALILSLTLNTSALANSQSDLVRDDDSPSLARVNPSLLQPSLLQRDLSEGHVSGDPVVSSHFLPGAYPQAKGEAWLDAEEWEGFENEDEASFTSLFTAKTPAEERGKTKALVQTDKDWESVGGAGRVLPTAETTFQRTGRRLVNTVVFVGKLALPFAVSHCTLRGINVAFDHVEPSVVNFMAQRSAESGARDAAYLTKWIPGGDSFVRLVYDQTTRDEVALRLVDTRNFCLNYSSALFSSVSLVTSSAWSGLKSWF
jgi:hypothetical protein